MTAEGRLPDPAFWRGRRVLLTGHTGFKGGWTALWLRRMGAEVTGLALAPDTEPSLFELAGIGADLHSHLIDLRDGDGVARVVAAAAPEIVLHLAAQPLVPRARAQPTETIASNVLGTAHLLEALRGVTGLKAILVVTSDKVYAETPDGAPHAESAPLGGREPYAASKAAADLIAHAFAESFFAPAGIALATARGGNVIGGGDFAADRIVPDIVRAARKGEAVLLRHPDAVRPWQHVLDCIAGYLVYAEALAAGEEVPRALNFGPGDGATVTVSELAEAVQAALGAKAGWRHAPVAGWVETAALRLDSSAARKALGWRDRLDGPAAVAATSDWYSGWLAGADMRAATLAEIDAYAAGDSDPPTPACRFCGARLTRSFLDLGEMPLANAYLPDNPAAIAAEARHPLHVMVCDSCLLVQVAHAVPPEAIFADDYAYLSSYAASWVDHARIYASDMAARFDLGGESTVVEVASNDGYLLRHFRSMGLDVLGVEPAKNVAVIAEASGIPTEVAFFDAETARRLAGRGVTADLMAANNVLAHVPDIAGFAAGFPVLLKPQGVATFEFPHLLNLIAEVQFDTIYHEHYSYLSLLVVEQVFKTAGLRVFDAEMLATHGGSLRLYACRVEAGHAETARLADLRQREAAAGLDRIEAYSDFAPRVAAMRDGFRTWLAEAKSAGRRVAGYGAAAKGNTFLNYCGVTADDIPFVVDRNPEKQGKLLPGTHIPVHPPEALSEARPDDVLILPWNLAEEIAASMGHVRDWGGRFVVAVPKLRAV